MSKAGAPALTDPSGVAYLSTADINYGFLVAHPDYAPVAWQKNPYQGNAEFAGDCVIKLDRGAAIGGTVRDATGQPLAGIGVEMTGAKVYWDEQKDVPFAQFPAYVSQYFPPIVTDAQGRWTCPHFPIGPSNLLFSFQRPGGGRHRVEVGNARTAQTTEELDLRAVRQGNLVTVFPDGLDVHGIVRDAAGHPLPGITLTERDRRSQDPIAVLQTDAQGRFTLTHRDPHQILLALTGEGFATTAQVVTVAPGLAEQDFTMSPPVPLRVHIVDEAGAPIAGASLAPTELQLGWTGQSDAQGRITWPAAPLEPEVYSLSAEKHPRRIMRLTPGAAETTVTLRSTGPEGTEVAVKALGEDGNPLAHFTVLAAYGDGSRSRDKGFEAVAEGRDGACVAVVPFEKSQGSAFRLRVEAPGLLPFTSGTLDPLAGEPALTATLRAGRALQGKVLLPGGQPAARASVIITNPAGQRSYINVSTFLKSKMRVEPRDAKTLHADAEGAFALPEIAPETTVIFIHDQGFLAITAGQLQGMTEVKLGAWGVVEGTHAVNGQPRAGQRLQLQSLSGQRPYDLSFTIDVKTDADGHFRFAPAPIGPCLIYATQPSKGQWPQSYATPVEVKEGGEITHLDVTGHGVTVTGRVRLSSPEAEVDWTKDITTALLSQDENERNAWPNYEDFIRQRDYAEAIVRASRPGILVRSSYPLGFAPDGSFQGEGVPPGKYRLRVSAARHDREPNQSANELGSLEKDVVIPAGKENGPIALGDFTVVVPEGAAPRRPPVQFTAQTFQGQLLPLTKYAGKQVLVVFWASWAPPSAETLAQWKQLYDAHGTDPRFAMVGISLDEDVDAAQKFVQAQQWHWDQAWLTGVEKAQITEKLGVDILPSVFLLGADGRLLTRNPAGGHLQTVIESFLSSNK
ncbi:MAG: carboxypeptidase regulatory-like domain-containing protein [Chthoniobacter sp.]|uniref:carboxypeptidase regulatory-like domain-containing protein n=1 Tax=Chthoniobacter sp. TaxID=2510640 RepID=UPI0032ABE262